MAKGTEKHQRRSYRVRNLLVAAAVSVIGAAGVAHAQQPVKLGLPIVKPVGGAPVKLGLPIIKKPHKHKPGKGHDGKPVKLGLPILK